MIRLRYALYNELLKFILPEMGHGLSLGKILANPPHNSSEPHVGACRASPIKTRLPKEEDWDFGYRKRVNNVQTLCCDTS